MNTEDEITRETASKIFQAVGGLNTVPWLTHPHVHLANPDKVVDKINSIIKGGRKNLQVIFDFDRTLSKTHHNGVPTESSYCVLERYPNFPDGFKESRNSMGKYRSIETDPTMTVEQKLPYMVEWWMEGIEAMKGMECDLVAVDKYLQLNQQPLRDGTEECFERLRSGDVPVLVFSAGMGDVVKSFMTHSGLLTSNVHIISNFFKIVDGRIAGYTNDIIHVFNKNEGHIKNTPYEAELSGRSNVILLGDSIGDASMADGVSHDTVLKIGFLNDNIDRSLSLYKEVFDIVLADDQTMDVLLNILKETLQY